MPKRARKGTLATLTWVSLHDPSQRNARFSSSFQGWASVRGTKQNAYWSVPGVSVALTQKEMSTEWSLSVLLRPPAHRDFGSNI